MGDTEDLYPRRLKSRGTGKNRQAGGGEGAGAARPAIYIFAAVLFATRTVAFGENNAPQTIPAKKERGEKRIPWNKAALHVSRFFSGERASSVRGAASGIEI